MKKGEKKKSPVFRVRVAGRREVAADTWETTCAIDDGRFPFRAGQHCALRLPRLEAADPRGPVRVFSMCSWAPDGRSVSFAFRDTGSGFKKTMLALPPGAGIELTAPRGGFVLPEDGAPRKIVLVAGGIGITPFLSMLKRRACGGRDPGHEITLHYVNRRPEAAAYLEELRALSEADPLFTMQEHYRREDLAAALAATPDPAALTWYIAGPGSMPSALRETLAGRGVPADRIITEEFLGYRAPAEADKDRGR